MTTMYQPEAETLNREALRELQLHRLRETLERIHANNPDYVQHLGGLGAEDVRSLEDLQRFPFLTKEDLRQAYPFKLACAPQTEFVRFQMSSGTTGTPVLCPYTEADVQQWAEIMARCLTAAGVTREDVVQITPGFGLFNGGFGFHYGASAIGAMIVPIGAGRSRLQLQFMKDLGTTVVAAIASYPLRLIEVAQEEGFDFRRDTRLRVGIFGAEVWSDEMRRRIEDAMGIESFDIIGMTESGGVGMGLDCPAHQGIHVWEDHYLVEIVDPATGEPVPDGEPGEMVVTTLTREALPLIRFRTRDITRIVSREPCACGRTHLRVDRIAGRTDDMLKVKGVNFYPKQIESILLRHKNVAFDYQIVLERVVGADRFRLVVETERPDDPELAQRLASEVYDLLGLTPEVELVPVGHIERKPGKAVRVVDKRD
jgi:phenylacetate-CoA ligase